MDLRRSLLRPLSHVEQAFTISNDASPLSVVCVLHLSSAPAPPAVRSALDRLQDRYLLLQAGIAPVRGRLSFIRLDPAPSLPLTVAAQPDGEAWRAVAEEALNMPFDRGGPLLRCWYLPGAEGGGSELIVGFHHAIVDGEGARLMLHELLCLMGGVALAAPEPMAPLSVFPPAYRGLTLARRLLALAGRQLGEEWRYGRGGAASPIPAHSRNAVLSVRLSPELSRKLSLRAGREGLSLNTVLLAAITQAVLRRRHAGKGVRRARVISFADLRPSVLPPVSGGQLGCYISMMRLCVPATEGQPVSMLAAHIRKALFRAGRRGEVFLMSWMSKYLVSLVLRLKNQRLSVSALSFIGKLDLQEQYGPLGLRHVSAFITNNRFGPELSAFGKVLFGSLGLDFTYLTAEMEESQARQIVREIEETLEKMANSPYFGGD